MFIQGHVVWYKVSFVAQGFIQRRGVDYNFTYFLIMDSDTFCYLLGVDVEYFLATQLLDVVTAYLYGTLDAIGNIKPLLDFLSKTPPKHTSESYSGLKLQKALYGLKQVSRMWYKHLRDFLLHHKF